MTQSTLSVFRVFITSRQSPSYKSSIFVKEIFLLQLCPSRAAKFTIFAFLLNAYVVAMESDTRFACGARAIERIENYVPWIAVNSHQPFDERYGFLEWVNRR